MSVRTRTREATRHRSRIRSGAGRVERPLDSALDPAPDPALESRPESSTEGRGVRLPSELWWQLLRQLAAKERTSTDAGVASSDASRGPRVEALDERAQRIGRRLATELDQLGRWWRPIDRRRSMAQAGGLQAQAHELTAQDHAFEADGSAFRVAGFDPGGARSARANRDRDEPDRGGVARTGAPAPAAQGGPIDREPRGSSRARAREGSACEALPEGSGAPGRVALAGEASRDGVDRAWSRNGAASDACVQSERVLGTDAPGVDPEPGRAACDPRLLLALGELREQRLRGALEVLKDAAWRLARAGDGDRDAAWCPEPVDPALERGAWRVLELEEREGRAVPHRPDLGESPQAVLERLVAASRAPEEVASPSKDLWKARLAWLRGEESEAQRLLRPWVAPSCDGPGKADALADPEALRQAVQWWLEIGKPGRALDVLEGAGEALHRAPDLAVWMGLCLALLGRASAARDWCCESDADLRWAGSSGDSNSIGGPRVGPSRDVDPGSGRTEVVGPGADASNSREVHRANTGRGELHLDGSSRRESSRGEQASDGWGLPGQGSAGLRARPRRHELPSAQVGRGAAWSRAWPWESERARTWRENCAWARALWPLVSSASASASASRNSGALREACEAPHSGAYAVGNLQLEALQLEALRRRWGAACVSVLAWNLAGELELWGSACAPNLAARWDAWWRALELDGPHGGQDQRRAMRESRELRWHAEPEGRLKRGAMGALALAIHPVFDRRSEPVAVLQVESEHHLLPTERELARVARSWTWVHWARLPATAATATPRESDGSDDRAGADFDWTDVDRGLARWASAAVERLPLKFGRRRWAWLRPAVELDAAAEGGAWSVVCTGGSVRQFEDGVGAPGVAVVAESRPSRSPLASETAAGRRILERAARWGTPVAWRADREHLGLWRDSRCGRVWPVLDTGRVVALLAIESERVDDLDDELEGRVQAALEHLGSGWSFQCFARDERCAGQPTPDPWYLFDVDPPAGETELFASREVNRRLAEWTAIAEDSRPLLLVGEPGVGARTVGAWMAWRRRQRHGTEDPRIAEAGHPRAASEWIEPTLGWGAQTDAAVRELVHQLQRRPYGLPDFARLRLTCWREARDAEPHPDAAAAVEAAARLWPGPCLRLRSLRERRAQVFGLAQNLWSRGAPAAGSANASDLPCAPLGRQTLEQLWRQPWPTQAAGLLAYLHVVAKHAATLRFEPADPVDLPVEVMREESERLGWRWMSKVPARHPKPAWLLDAVATSRHANGRVNMRGAAALLGWDRQTFTRRWREGPGRHEEVATPRCSGSFPAPAGEVTRLRGAE
jgi:hypothetical protein